MKALLLVFCFVLSFVTYAQNRETLTNIDWNKQIFYFTLLDRFYDGEKSNNISVDKKDIRSFHGGDLQGLNQKFSYFHELGATGLIFTPLLENRKKDFYGHDALHGYWPLNHFKLDPHWGTFKDLNQFNKLRAKNHMTFLADIVLNHVTWDHPWLKSRKKWFNTLGPITDWNDPKQLIRGQVTGLPDLNQDNPSVYNFLLKYTKFWIEKTKSQGIRLDAIKHIDHPFWKKFFKDMNQYVKQNRLTSDFLYLGELLHGDPNAYKPYVKDGFNSFYNYPLYYSIKECVAEEKPMYQLAARWQELDRSFGKKVTWVNFIDNHDLPRFLSLNKNLKDDHVIQALAMAMYYPGIPLLYYGTEENMRGKNGEAGRKSLTFKRRPILKKIQHLIAQRKEYSDFLKSKRKDLTVSDDLYISKLKDKNRELYLMFYRIGRNKSFTLPDRNHVIHPNGSGFELLIMNKQTKITTPQFSTITIHLQAPIHQDFYLVGNLPLIGKWNAQKALKLQEKAKGHYTLKMDIPYGQILLFKFIQKKRGEVHWENINSNRFLFPQKSRSATYKWNK